MFKDLIQPLTDREIAGLEIATGQGPMSVLLRETVGDFTILHGRGVLTGHPISVSFKSEVKRQAA